MCDDGRTEHGASLASGARGLLGPRQITATTTMPLKRGKPGAIRTTWGTDEPARHKSNHPAPRAFPALQNEDYASLGKLTDARFLGSNLRPFR
jgi:hypothetical protein